MQLFVGWTVALLSFVRVSGRRRLGLGAAVTASALLVISPVIIRNIVVFYPEIAPPGLLVGLNLWEGIGETERRAEFNAPGSDVEVIEQEHKEMGLPTDAPLGSSRPDGICRDRERARKALAVMRAMVMSDLTLNVLNGAAYHAARRCRAEIQWGTECPENLGAGLRLGTSCLSLRGCSSSRA